MDGVGSGPGTGVRVVMRPLGRIQALVRRLRHKDGFAGLSTGFDIILLKWLTRMTLEALCCSVYSSSWRVDSRRYWSTPAQCQSFELHFI